MVDSFSIKIRDIQDSHFRKTMLWNALGIHDYMTEQI